MAPPARRRLYGAIRAYAQAYSVVVIEADEIDRSASTSPTSRGMRRAVAALHTTPGYVPSDGFEPGARVPSLPIIAGDANAACIAAASILAKVTRDDIMARLDDELPDTTSPCTRATRPSTT